MANAIAELLVTEAAIEKLGARGISIEQTADPTTWLIITGWEAADRERRILDG